MAKLTGEKKRDLFFLAKKNAEGIIVDWPLAIDRINAVEIFCNKCNKIHRKPPNTYDACPVHGRNTGMSTSIYDNRTKKLVLVYFHYEEQTDGNFWIYRLHQYFNRKSVKTEVELDGVLIYEKDDIFYLSKTGENVVKKAPKEILRSLWRNIQSNIVEILDNKKFIEETGFLDAYYLYKGIDNQAEKIMSFQKETSKESFSLVKEMIKIMTLHKKELANVKILKEHGYSSAIEYLSSKKYYKTIKNLMVSENKITCFNLDAKHIKDFMSEDIELIEGLKFVVTDQREMDALKLGFNATNNKDVFLDLINSPITRNFKPNWQLGYFLNELFAFGYKIEDIWEYAKEKNLKEGLSVSEVSQHLLSYYKISKIYNKTSKDYPENLLGETSRLNSLVGLLSKKMEKGLFDIGTNFISLPNHVSDDAEIVQIKNIDELYNHHYRFRLSGTLNLKSDDLLNAYYLISKTGHGAEARAIVAINSYGRIHSVYFARASKGFDIQKWVRRAVNNWAKKENFITDVQFNVH